MAALTYVLNEKASALVVLAPWRVHWAYRGMRVHARDCSGNAAVGLPVICVAPSREETWPIRSLKQWRGLPVVSMNVGGMPDVAISDGKNGRLVDAGNPQALALVLCEFSSRAVNARAHVGYIARNGSRQIFCDTTGEVVRCAYSRAKILTFCPYTAFQSVD